MIDILFNLGILLALSPIVYILFRIFRVLWREDRRIFFIITPHVLWLIFIATYLIVTSSKLYWRV